MRGGYEGMFDVPVVAAACFSGPFPIVIVVCRRERGMDGGTRKRTIVVLADAQDERSRFLGHELR